MASWQSEINSISNCLKHILEFSDFSDVTFSFGDPSNLKKIKAHKLILAMRSDVFKAMFYGGMNKQESDIHITDINEHIFEFLLKYIYTDQFLAESPEDQISLFYAAHKYHIPLLMNLCREKVQSKLNGQNVCEIFPIARLLEDEMLINKCETIMPSYSKDVTDSQSFTRLPANVMEHLIRENKLNLNQADLYKAILKWAKCQMEENKEYLEEESDDDDDDKQLADKLNRKMNIYKQIRSAMNPFIPYINFLSMKLEEFIKLPDLLTVFTKTEIVHIALNIAKIENITLPDWFGRKLKAK